MNIAHFQESTPVEDSYGEGSCSLNDIAVSVIVPIYNVAPWLDACLTSLEKQTLKNIEVILVNDGSTDGSEAIAKRYADRNDNFTLINRVNGGLSAARNTGLDRANGEYVYFLDSDDYLLENALETLYTKASGEQLDVLKFCAYTFTDSSEELRWASGEGYRYRESYPGIYKGMDALQRFLDNSNYFPSCCLIFTRRALIEAHGLRFYEGIIYEDNLFHFQLMAFSERVAVMNEPFYCRRIRAGSITSASDYEKRYRSLCICIREINSFAEKHCPAADKVRDQLLRFLLQQMLHYWSALPAQMQASDETGSCLREIQPVIEKHGYCGSFGLRAFFLSPNGYRLYRWSGSVVKRILRR